MWVQGRSNRIIAEREKVKVSFVLHKAHFSIRKGPCHAYRASEADQADYQHHTA
jgi:hypothetical protein